MTERTVSFAITIKATREREIPSTKEEFDKVEKIIEQEVAELHRALEHYQFATTIDYFRIY
mgnify:CR=1 FL=1